MAEGQAERPEHDDDLLSFADAAARLADEIADEERRLTELEEQARSGGGNDVTGRIARARERIAALEAAKERNTRPPPGG